MGNSRCDPLTVCCVVYCYSTQFAVCGALWLIPWLGLLHPSPKFPGNRPMPWVPWVVLVLINHIIFCKPPLCLFSQRTCVTCLLSCVLCPWGPCQFLGWRCLGQISCNAAYFCADFYEIWSSKCQNGLSRPPIDLHCKNIYFKSRIS